MFASKIARVATIGAAAAVMVGLSASPSLALEPGEDFATLANKTISISEGSLKFIDDGDIFEICDNQADGKPIRGALFYNSYWNADGYVRVKTFEDGGDAGCDRAGYNIGNSGSYSMVICPGFYPTRPFVTGIDGCTDSGEFNE
ncbi:hypothetical protein [Streptomyces uncialis]|uniref:hypothetical protein n=1 Tax=Streptomyces uncialis TaxID=1048205 RepID=UPI003866AEEE|nr:hypothetical protein OG268_31855 [Streptomyces uncialis]